MAQDHDLTVPERRVWNAAEAGDPVNFRVPGEPELDEAAAAKWGPERSVRAWVLAEILTTKGSPNGHQRRAVRLAGARITGTLDLEALTLGRALILEACFFENSVRLDEACAPHVQLTACWLPALSARQIETRGDLTLDRVNAHQVVLAGARIGGVLALRDARLQHTHGTALDGAGLDVRLGMDAARLEASGELNLLGAHVGGSLNFSGACLSNEDGLALNAAALEVDQDVLCEVVDGQPFSAKGEVRMVGAHVGGRLSFNGARLSNEDGHALWAEWLRADQSVLFDKFDKDDEQPFTATGEVCLISAEVGDQLSLQGARVINAGIAVHLPSVRARQLFLSSEYPPVGVVDLTNAVVGLFDDGWPAPRAGIRCDQYQTRLAGFVYESLGSDSADCAARLDWLRHANEGYVPHAYDQLAAVFRRAGRDEDARRVAIAKQRHRRDQLSGPEKAVSYVLDAAAGYGYRTWRVAYALLTVVLIGWGVFAWAAYEHLTATRPVGQRTDFQPWLYSIDAVLPVVNLGQESAWSPTGAAQIWYAFSVLSGWLLSLGLIAILTATLFRE